MVKKSETSGIMIPDVIQADDVSVRTMSPIESPLSLARKKLTAHMINERVAMIRAGMTPEEIIAHYEKKQKGKKKGKGSKAQDQLAIPDVIPELTSLHVPPGGSALPPPPPAGMPLLPPPPLTEASGSESLAGRKIQTFQDMMRQQPSHFQANLQLPQQRDENISLLKTPRPSHVVAFEQARLRSNNHRDDDEVIRTASLKRYQRNGGGAAPPHFLAFQNGGKSKKKPHCVNKSTDQPTIGEPETLSISYSSISNTEDLSTSHASLSNSKDLSMSYGSRSNSKNHGDDRGSKPDLSKELNAFWARQRRANSVRKLDTSDMIMPPVRRSQSITVPMSGDTASRLGREGSPTTRTNEQARRSRSNDGLTRASETKEFRRRARSNDGISRDGEPEEYRRRSRSSDGIPHECETSDSLDFLEKHDGEVRRHSGELRKPVPGEKLTERRGGEERRQSFTRIERRNSGECKKAESVEKMKDFSKAMKRVEPKQPCASERKLARKPERINSLSPTGEYEPMRRVAPQVAEPEKRPQSNNGNGVRRSSYTVKLKPSAVSPMRGGHGPRAQPHGRDVSNAQYLQRASPSLPPPLSPHGQSAPPEQGDRFGVAIVSGLPMQRNTNCDDSSFVGNNDFENGSFKSIATMNTRSTVGTRRTVASVAMPYSLRDSNLVQVTSHDDESVTASVANAFGTIRRNETFVKQTQVATERT